MKALTPIERKSSPFDVPPPMTNETPHWVKPALVAQVRFTEWTDDTSSGIRRTSGCATTVAREVRREAGGHARGGSGRTPSQRSQCKGRDANREGRRRHDGAKVRLPPDAGQQSPRHSVAAKKSKHRRAALGARRRRLQLVVDQLHEIEAERKAKAVLVLPDGDSLDVTNLHKVFWPSEGLTKGDLIRYYVRSRRSSCRS